MLADKKNDCGILYICATPIGNLEDITLRAIRVFKEVDIIAVEDTRHTRKLLNHFDINTATISYHEHNKEQRNNELLNLLKEGKNIALVSDAGMPGISDPGMQLVQIAADEGISIVPLPGANALLPALVVSGIDTTHFTFIGFLPKTIKKRRAFLQCLATHPYTMVFYESPHRILRVLKEINEFMPLRQAAVAKELTKKFETVIRADLNELSEYFTANQPRGEFVIVVAGLKEGNNKETEKSCSPIDEVWRLIETGINKKDAIRKVASENKISRRNLYQSILECGEN